MRINNREIYHGKYFRHGNGYAIYIPPDIRTVMELQPGDTILMNFIEGVLWCRRATATMVINRERAGAIFEKLFADKKEPHAGNGT